MFRVPVLFALVSAFSVGVLALSNITRTGRYLYDDTGSRFYIKGVAYQPPPGHVVQPASAFGTPTNFVDALADSAGCQRDLPFLQQLGVNVVRAYSVNSSLDHDDCMNTFSQANIYVILDLELSLNGTFDRDAPTWSTNLLDEYLTTVEVFSKYDNVLAFNVGNEVIPVNQTSLSPFVKAAARDVKAYINSIGSSALVGYGSIDMPSASRIALSEYFSCDPSGTNSGTSSVDLFGLNAYEWCGNSTFQASDANIVNDFENYNVVTYFSEYGCVSKPRLWTEVGALFGPDMAPTFSGGLAFSYFQSVSRDGQFGMVNISSDGTSVITGDDFNLLVSEYGQVSFIDSPPQSAAPSATYPSCAATSPGADFAASSILPPTPNDAACNCIYNSLTCRFTPATSNPNSFIGELTDEACGFLGQNGLNCDAISSDGSTGTYGVVAECDPTVKLSYIMSQFYEQQDKNAAACSFGGNGTVNRAGTPVASVATTCNIGSDTTVFTPSSVPSPVQVTAAPAGSGSTKSGAIVRADYNALLGVGTLALVMVMSSVWTLA